MVKGNLSGQNLSPTCKVLGNHLNYIFVAQHDSYASDKSHNVCTIFVGHRAPKFTFLNSL